MDTLNDLEFGPMNFGGSVWVLEHPALFNGIEAPVQIEPEDAESRTIAPVQRQAVILALSPPPDMLNVSASAVVQNYEVYREMIGDEELPPLQSPTDVWQEVTPSYIEVPAHGSVDTPTFLLLAECAWDPEHGLVVRFRNGLADAASQQGELGLED